MSFSCSSLISSRAVRLRRRSTAIFDHGDDAQKGGARETNAARCRAVDVLNVLIVLSFYSLRPKLYRYISMN